MGQTGNRALRTALEEKGIKTESDRRKFAESLGMSGRTLQRWVNDNTTPQTIALGRLVARRLGVKYDDLWAEQEAA